MHECAGKIGMAGNMASGGEQGNLQDTGTPDPVLTPKAKNGFCLTNRQIANVIFVVVNLAILGIHSLVAVESPGVDPKILKHKYPQFLEIIAAHKSLGSEEDKKCLDETNCKISLEDLVGKTTIHTTGVLAVKYEGQTLWNYYLNTVIRNQYEKVMDTGQCLTGVCGDDNTNDGTTAAHPCKWCDFNFGNSTTSYSIQECQDDINYRGSIYLGNLITHLVVVIVCIVLLLCMPKETQFQENKHYDNYIRVLIWLGASLYLVGNFGYLVAMLMKDHDGDNICAEILTGRTVRGGAFFYIILSFLYLAAALFLMLRWREGSVKRQKVGGVAYTFMPRV